MRRFAFVLLALFGLSACAGQGNYGSHTVLVMGEDQDSESVSRSSRVHSRALNEIADELSSSGFHVFDETAVTSSSSGHSRRSSADLIDLARGVRNPPIDTAALFTIYTDVTRRAYTSKLHMRIASRLLDVHDGGHQGNFEVTKSANIRPDCTGSCEIEAASRLAKKLAGEVGRELADRLGSRIDSSRRPRWRNRDRDDDGLRVDYALEFDNFSKRQIRDIEDYLVIFRGYKSHRVTTSFSRHVEFNYRSSIRRNRLVRNLRRMLDKLDISAQVNFDGDEFNIRQTQTNRGRRRYRRDREYRN
jgi:hypothetical protein